MHLIFATPRYFLITGLFLAGAVMASDQIDQYAIHIAKKQRMDSAESMEIGAPLPSAESPKNHIESPDSPEAVSDVQHVPYAISIAADIQNTCTQIFRIRNMMGLPERPFKLTSDHPRQYIYEQVPDDSIVLALGFHFPDYQQTDRPKNFHGAIITHLWTYLGGICVLETDDSKYHNTAWQITHSLVEELRRKGTQFRYRGIFGTEHIWDIAIYRAIELGSTTAD